MPKNLPLRDLLAPVLLLFVCTTPVVHGEFQFSCPGDEELLYSTCTFINEELLNSVKAGQSDELSLVTQNVDDMSNVCSATCQNFLEMCFPMSPAYGLAASFCDCREPFRDTPCDVSFRTALPVFTNPQFSVSNYHLGLDAGIPVTEKLNSARSTVCGNSCQTTLETSEQCSYSLLRDAINAMCCGPISQQCTDLYTTMTDLSDPTDPEKFPVVVSFLAAVDDTKTLDERWDALENSEVGLNTVTGLFLAPLEEMCATLDDATPADLSSAIDSCTTECPGLAKPDVEQNATTLEALCSVFSDNPCIREAFEACMPSFSAARLIGIEEVAVATGRMASDQDGSRRRLLLEYEGVEKTIFKIPADKMVELIDKIDDQDELSDDLQALQTSLCSAECGARIDCPALSELSALPISNLFDELRSLRSSSFCVLPTPTPTPTPPPATTTQHTTTPLPPPTPSSPVSPPAPPVTTAPPVPITTPSTPVQSPPPSSTPPAGSTQREYRVVRLEVKLPEDSTDALEAQMVTELAALQGVNPENVKVLNVKDGNIVELAVVVIDEGGDDNFQNLSTTMASASNFFSREFGDVTARIIETETFDSLGAATQRVEALEAEAQSDEDSAADRYSASLSLLLAATLLGVLLL